MGNHESYNEQSEWYTPWYIFDALGCAFDMDVAAAPNGLGCVPAEIHCRDAFNTNWNGFVWCNPPWAGRGQKEKWIRKMYLHRNGILLLPDRSSTDWWQYAAKSSTSLLMVSRKIKFVPGIGNMSNWKSPGCGTTLFAFGKRGMDALLLGQTNGLGVCLKTFYEK
jgi:hypothetical protein